MNAYLTTGIYIATQKVPWRSREGVVEEFRTVPSGRVIIVFGDTQADANSKFEAMLLAQSEQDNSKIEEVKKISSAQVINQFFTEAGPIPLDWAEIRKRVEAQFEAIGADDFEQGNWLDAGQAVPPEPLSTSIEDLQRDLPEDISTGLNWSGEKQFLFVLSLLTPPIDLSVTEGPEADAPVPQELTDEDEIMAAEFHEWLMTHPEAADKEAAAIVRARNSAVAAWLWRRYAAGKQLAALPIRLDSWFGALGEPNGDDAGLQASGQA